MTFSFSNQLKTLGHPVWAWSTKCCLQTNSVSKYDPSSAAGALGTGGRPCSEWGGQQGVIWGRCCPCARGGCREPSR